MCELRSCVTTKWESARKVSSVLCHVGTVSCSWAVSQRSNEISYDTYGTVIKQPSFSFWWCCWEETRRWLHSTHTTLLSECLVSQSRWGRTGQLIDTVVNLKWLLLLLLSNKNQWEIPLSYRNSVFWSHNREWGDSYFLAGAVFCRFHILSVWSSEAVTRTGSTGWKTRARIPSKWLRRVNLGFHVFLMASLLLPIWRESTSSELNIQLSSFIPCNQYSERQLNPD